MSVEIVDLAFDPKQLRGPDGRWIKAGTAKVVLKDALSPTFTTPDEDYVKTRVGILRPSVKAANRDVEKALVKSFSPIAKKKRPALMKAESSSKRLHALTDLDKSSGLSNREIGQHRTEIMRSLGIKADHHDKFRSVPMSTLKEVSQNKGMPQRDRIMALAEIDRRQAVGNRIFGPGGIKEKVDVELKKTSKPEDTEAVAASKFDMALIRVHPWFARAFFHLRDRILSEEAKRKRAQLIKKHAGEARHQVHEAAWKSVLSILAAAGIGYVSNAGIHVPDWVAERVGG